jgi:hypothetical protein
MTSEGTFHGTWATNHGPLELVACGERVIGTYGVVGATLDGTVSGDVLEGTWSDYSGHGTFRLELGEDRKITGTWTRVAGTGGAAGEWTGVERITGQPVVLTASTMPFIEQIDG